MPETQSEMADSVPNNETEDNTTDVSADAQSEAADSNPPNQNCPVCGQNPCICNEMDDAPPESPCPNCGQNPCVCGETEDAAQCPKCGQYPCVCDPDTDDSDSPEEIDDAADEPMDDVATDTNEADAESKTDEADTVEDDLDEPAARAENVDSGELQAGSNDIPKNDDENEIINITTGDSPEMDFSSTSQNITDESIPVFSNDFDLVNNDSSSKVNAESGSSDISESESAEIQAYKNKLKEFCESNGYAETVDFSDIDHHVAYDLVKSVADAKKDFPELKVNYLGSIDHQVKGIRDSIQQKSYEFYVNSGLEDEVASKLAEQYADNWIKESKLDKTDGTYAWSLTSGNSFLEKYDGVAVNTHYAKDYAYFKSQKAYDEKTKWAPIGCGSPKAVTDHELGHEIDKLLGASEDETIKKMYSDMMEKSKAEDVLSGYSAKNVKEFIAEAYSEYRNNPKPRATSVALYKRLIALRDQKNAKGVDSNAG